VALQRLIVSSDQFRGNQIGLTAEQQHYLYRVLRLSAGKQFIALDGQGSQWRVELTDNSTWATLLDPQSPLPGLPPQPPIALAVAIPKGSGLDDLVRQATELGIATLQPLITERTLHRPNPKKLERWQRIAAEATEQSERLLLPTIATPLPWAEFAPQTQGAGRFICVARGPTPHLLNRLQQHPGALAATPITIATGPEGGWTPAEIALAIDCGFEAVSLGSGILRAVTAPLAALAIARAVLDGREGSPLRSDSQ
jgi:16S rRNA (uracil1498-N3)-methyltransferase